MHLLYSKPSPYSSKVRMAALHCGIELDCVPTDTGAEGSKLVGANPAGKIPTLIADDGTAVYDSRVICEYFDRLSGNQLIPQTLDAWLEAKRTEALADAMTEAAMAVLYERRYRPEEKWHEPWTTKQWRRARRCLEKLEETVDALPTEPGIAHFALASDLGWLELRFPGTFADLPALTRWYESFFETHARFAELRPQA